MSNLDVSIVVVPRERFSHSERSLENLIAHIPPDIPLIYVCAGAPPHIQRYLEQQANSRPFTLISRPNFLTPNQARNLGLQEVQTKYVVFLDNDTLVTPGWLELLVQCANDTQAWLVGPLYLIGELHEQMIHMAGGTIQIEEANGSRTLIEDHRLANTHFSKVPVPLTRESCDYLEFHCLLARSDFFQKIGALDEDLWSVHEHIDISLATRQAGGTIMMEPRSVISYVAPPPCEWWDLPYFLLRWSERWTRHSVQHFKHKWGISKLLYQGDHPSEGSEDTIIGWGRGHRRLMAGLEISEKDLQESGLGPFYQAALMAALFDSVDRGEFDLHLSNPNRESQHYCNLEYPVLIEQLPERLQEAKEVGLHISLGICGAKHPQQPILFCVENLKRPALELLRPLSFLILQSSSGQYHCWMAIAKGTWNGQPRVRHLIRQKSSEEVIAHEFGLAGSASFASLSHTSSRSYQQISLFEAKVGHLVTANQIENSSGLPLLESGIILN